MLGDILKAVQLILDGLKARKGPDQRRRTTGAKLKTIHHELLQVVEKGDEILSLIRDSENMSLERFENCLTEKQELLLSLCNRLRDKELLSTVEIYVPEFSTFHVLVGGKGTVLSFLVDELLSAETTARLGVASFSHFRKYHESESAEEREKRGSVTKDLEESFGFYACHGTREVSAYRPREVKCGERILNNDPKPRIIATDDAVEALKKILQEMRETANALREFLKTEFHIEELA